MRGRCSLLLAWTLTSAAAARAAEGPAPVATGASIAPELALTWQAPAGCPTPNDVAAQFARLLGGAARLPSEKHITATALVRAAAPERWSVDLSTVLDGAVGRRNLTGDSCASVTSAAALILALMIDPGAAERALLAPPERPVDEVRPPATRPGEAVLRRPGPRAAASAAFRATARAFGGAVVGLLPVAAPAGGLALGADYRGVGVEVSFASTTQRRVGAAAETAGDFRLLMAGARACGTLGGTAVIWQLCLGGELERLTGTGAASPLRMVNTQTALMGAATGGLLLTLPLGARVGLSLDLDAAARPYHPAFVDLSAQIFRVPVASAFAALGVLVTL